MISSYAITQLVTIIKTRILLTETEINTYDQMWQQT